MARSRVGGSSAKLSGVLGSLVFSVGKNAVGGYEQYIATYNPEKVNPNTKFQALARMQIAVIERMVHILTPILRVSFENVSVGVQSINEFSRVNVKDIQSYCKNYWNYAYGWSFPLKGNPLECWAPLIISYGSLKIPNIWSITYFDELYFYRIFRLQAPVGKYRVADLRKALNLTRKGSFTMVLIWGVYQSFNTGGAYFKVSISKDINDYDDYRAIPPKTLWNVEPVITAVAIGGEHRTTMNINYVPSNNKFEFLPSVSTRGAYSWVINETFLAGLIYSDYRQNKWRKSTSRLEPPKVYDPDEEYGRAPYEAFRTWDENYWDEEYHEYFGK